MTRLAIVASHPIQYYAPIFRELARRVDLHVFYGQRLSPDQQARAGFGHSFEWDVDLLSGYEASFLGNVATRPGPHHFLGCDTPEIGERLQNGRFDALLVLGWYLKSFVQAIWAAKRLGMPAMVRGDSQLNTPRNSMTRLAKALAFPTLLRAFDAALYVGERSRAYFEHYRYPARRLFFSPHCVDNQWFSARGTSQAGRALRAQLGIAPDEPVVLFAGKLLPFKRPLDLIEACGLDRAENVQLLVAGSGELESAMRERARALGVKSHFLGFQNQTQMPAVYAASNLLVLPSTARETWGLVANEALACGTPVVVSDVAGCGPDLAADGKAGRTFPVSNPTALAEAIGKVLTSPPSRQSIEAKLNDYSVTAAGDGIAKALEAVTKGPLSPRSVKSHA